MDSDSIPTNLVERFRRLFRFYDRDGDGIHTLTGDFKPVAQRIVQRWQDRPTPFPDLLQLLLDTYGRENSRRDANQDGSVNLEEFLSSHGRVIAAYATNRIGALGFIKAAAGGFFDVLDLDGDGDLTADDLRSFAAAYGHGDAGIAANLNEMLTELKLPPDRLPRHAFLLLVEQYWFDPSEQAPGRRLFDGLELGALNPPQDRSFG